MNIPNTYSNSKAYTLVHKRNEKIIQTSETNKQTDKQKRSCTKLFEYINKVDGSFKGHCWNIISLMDMNN